MVIVLSYQVWQISPLCLVARQPSIITSKSLWPVFRKGIIMLYLTIITDHVLSLYFQIYKIEGVENKHSLFCFEICFEDFNVSLDWNEA